MRILFLIFMLLPMLALGGCSSSSKTDVVEEQQSAEMLYDRASKAMEEELYLEATRLFEEVERQHPYSELATDAQIMAAVASYKDERYDDAIFALDRYISLHPGHERVDYAYYLKAQCYYDQISDVRRDQDMTFQALEALDTLLSRFPKSDYRRDAELKRDLALDHLAGKEMEIGRYYLNRGHINSAISRFSEVVAYYQTTTHVPEALHRLVEAYLTLGIREEALKIAMVLGYNYPGSVWYKRSYELLDDEMREELIAKRSLWDRTVDGLFKPE